jgi:hypothetical protein
MPRTDAAAELAARLSETLRGMRQRGGPYPVTVADLTANLDPPPSPEEAERALVKKPYSLALLRARKKDLASPIALAEDAELFASSDHLLEFALRRLCTAEKPLHPVARVAMQVDATLRPAFTAAVERRLTESRLPASTGTRVAKGKPHLYLHAFPPPPPKKHPAEELSERLVAALEIRRNRAEADPPTLAELAAEAAGTLARSASERPVPSLALRACVQATTREPFRTRAVWAVPGKIDALVALAEDAAALADSPRLLEYLLRATTSARRPLIAPGLLQDRLGEAIRPLFAEALARRLRDNQLPASVGVLMSNSGAELFLEPIVPPTTLLALRLLRTLESRRQRGSAAYPVALSELAHEADPTVSPDSALDALRDKRLKPHVVAALPGPSSPVALIEDAARLAAWPPLLENALAAARTPTNQALAATDLKKKVGKAVQRHFAAALEQRITEGNLPPEVGLLHVKGKPLLFLIADLAENRVSSPAPPESKPTPAQPLGQKFDEVFDRLDRERGGHNLVSLVDLRRELGVERAAFDAELTKLRRAGRYSLSGAEGRHGITTEEKEAGIVEGGILLLYVSRRKE